MAKRAAPHRGIDVHYGDADDDADARPSKTRLKQQSHELQRLGEAISAWPPDKLQGLGLPEPELRDEEGNVVRAK